MNFLPFLYNIHVVNGVCIQVCMLIILGLDYYIDLPIF